MWKAGSKVWSIFLPLDDARAWENHMTQESGVNSICAEMQ